MIIFDSPELFDYFINKYAQIFHIDMIYNNNDIKWSMYNFFDNGNVITEFLYAPAREYSDYDEFLNMITNLLEESVPREIYYIGNSSVSRFPRLTKLNRNATRVGYSWGDSFVVGTSWNYTESQMFECKGVPGDCMINTSVSDKQLDVDFSKYNNIIINSIDKFVNKFYNWCRLLRIERYYAVLYVDSVGAKKISDKYKFIGLSECLRIVFGAEINDTTPILFVPRNNVDEEEVEVVGEEEEETKVAEAEKNNEIECNICCDNKKDICMIPCGHTFCSSCYYNDKERSNRMSSSQYKCMTCRNVVQMTNVVYI